MFAKVKKLNVKYNDRIVGYLAELEDEKIAFQYDDEWLKSGFSISPFSLPVSNRIFINEKDNFGGLYGVFNDSLPDGWGELLVRRMLSKNGINPDTVSPLTKLSLISGNGLGGLTYEPSQMEEEDNSKFNLDILATEAQKVLNDSAEEINLDEIFRLGGSSGGARPKAHIKIDGEEWIVKFPCHYDPADIGEREFKANSVAQKCGIELSEFRLFNSEICSGYFGSKRFDRVGERRLHMISLSSLLETSHRIPNLDYCHLFQVIQRISGVKEDLYEAYRRMCFNVFYKNKDDHGKNFAFIYDEQIKDYRLSPAYDLTPMPNKFEHEMTVNGAGNPTETDLIDIAKIFKLSMQRCKKIISDTKEIISNI